MKHVYRILFVAVLILGCLAHPKPLLGARSEANSAKEKFQIPESDDGLPGVGPIRRYDWFQKLWQERRRDFADRRESERGALVFLGDSITQGWGEDLGGSFPGVSVANRGISGDTTRGMLLRLQEDVLALDPSGIVLLAGTNDIEEGASPAAVSTNMSLILQKILAHSPRIPVVLCRVFPSSPTKKRPAEAVREVNRLYGKIAADLPAITYLDTWTLFADEEGNARAEEFPDLLHPNERGYEKWALALRPVLATLGFLETEPEDLALEPGFESLLNGSDLTGWGFRPTSREDLQARSQWQAADPLAAPWPIVFRPTDFRGRDSSPEGRFVVRSGRLIVTIPPAGRKIQQLWTLREFAEDFILKLEFRATPNADSGIYLRGRQLQCRDYALAGPYKNLKGYRPQEWNEITVRVTAGRAYCTCNGEVLEEDFELPLRGPIGLEGDRGQMEYRRIRIKELP